MLFDTAPAGVALGIDNSNNIVGQIGTGTASTNYAFIANSSGGTVPFATACIDLGMLSGDASSLAWSVANGNVVGQSSSSSGAGRAVLWAGGTASGIVDLNTVIPAGTGWDTHLRLWRQQHRVHRRHGTLNGVTQAFLLTPAATPEPSTLLLAAAGLVGLLAYAWQKHKIRTGRLIVAFRSAKVAPTFAERKATNREVGLRPILGRCNFVLPQIFEESL